MSAMNPATAHELWAGLVGFLLSAAMLWLGAQLIAAARQRTGPLLYVLSGAGAVLTACGVWWPGHLMPRVGSWSAEPGIGAVFAWGLALTWVAFASGTAAFASRSTLPAFGALAVGTVMISYCHAMVVAPVVFRAVSSGLPRAPAVVVLVLAAALVALALEHPKPEIVRTVRASAALLAAAVLSLTAASSMPTAASGASRVFDIGLLAPTLLFASLLVFVLQRSSSNAVAAGLHSARAATAVDTLTQLPTRVFFEKRLAAAAEKCGAKKHGLALLFIDLDGFKPVNDTFGHGCGDRVLEQVGKRLRAMSGAGSVAARVGGDEFLLLLTSVSSPEAVARMATRLIQGLSRPYRIDAREICISCSVGIALYPDDCDHTKLIARADAAMYSAKRSGGSNHCFYSPALDADAHETFELLRDLRKAVAKDEFELFYQPKMDAKTGLVTAAEALLRWNHPTRGVIMPDVLIPVAERFGLIGAIGTWVIEDACRQARVWREHGLRMRVAINLSAQCARTTLPTRSPAPCSGIAFTPRC